MTDQLSAAAVSGIFAMVVAVCGIVGAIAAQVVATRRAHANAIELLDRQRAERVEARREERMRDDAFRFATERRIVYARFMRLGAELTQAHDRARAHTKDLERKTRVLTGAREARASQLEAVAEAERAVAQERLTIEKAAASLGEVLEEVTLLASPPVREAAVALARQAGNAAYATARAQFVAAARRELGLE